MATASFREVRRYVCPDVSADIVMRAARQLRMKLLDSDGEFLTFSVRLNFSSWGERVAVALGTVEGRRLVDITSSCVLPMQIADWGKNERNVRDLFDELDRLLGDKSEHGQCSVCGECGYLLVGLPTGACPECGQEHAPNDGQRQDQAALKSAITLAFVFGGVEIGAIYLLDLLGLGRLVPEMLHGARGAVFLGFVNVAVVLAVVGLNRLYTRFRRRP